MFALSLVPVYLVEATTLTTVFLALIHTVVAAILVPALRMGDRHAAPAARTAAQRPVRPLVGAPSDSDRPEQLP